MKHTGKRFAATVLALLVTAGSLTAPGALLTASAHSGRTDSGGGHHDYKNASGLGSYHYHHGYPAHLHENGVCPYDTPQTPVPEPVPAPALPTPVPLPDVPAQPPVQTAEPAAEAAVNYAAVYDAAYYAAANPDAAAVYGTDETLLFQHFLTVGMAEGRQGNAVFNVWAYREANPDLAAVFGDNLAQYYTFYCMNNGVS